MSGIRIGLAIAACGLALAAAIAPVAIAAPWFGPTERWLNGLAVLGTLAALFAIARRDVAARVAVASLMFLGAPALRVGELLGHPLPYVAWDHASIASITSVAVVVAVVGLARRLAWARWLGLGGALAGLGGSVLNGLGTVLHPGLLTWGHAVAAAGCASLVLLLSGDAMRDAFEGRSAAEGLWRSADPVVSALRWTLITTLVSAPMLLVYALVQPIVPGTREVAVSLAVLQIAATLLCVRRKVIGAVLLTLAGSALLVFTIACAARAHALGSVDPWIMSYYAVFWVPAGVVSTAAGAVLLRPLVVLLRR